MSPAALAILKAVDGAGKTGLHRFPYRQMVAAGLVRDGYLVPPSGTKWGWRLSAAGRTALKAALAAQP